MTQHAALPPKVFPMADAVPCGIAAVDAEGTQVYVNDAFARMVQWPREELIGARPPFVYWPADQLDTLADVFQRTLRGDMSASGIRFTFKRRDSGRLDVLITFAPIGGGPDGGSGWVASVTDITAQVAATRRLEALQRATSALTPTLTPAQVAGVVMAEAVPAVGATRGGVAVIDQATARLEVIGFHGYSAETEARYRHIALDAAFPLTDAVREARALYFRDTAARTARYPHLAQLLRENGAGAMASIPLVAADRVIGVLGLNWSEDHEFDADERSFLEALAHQCAQALERARLYDDERRARADAEAANRAKSDFLAAMSHELRTPLNGIAGYVNLLELGVRGPVTEAQRADLERIRANQRHLSRLIEDVLSFARIEAGHLEVAEEPVALDATLASLESLAMPQLLARGLRYVFEPAAEPVLALGDRERIIQICLNLLTNAAKATPSGGEIAVRCECDEQHVFIRIRDTGVGIPPDKLDVIFSPFTQLGRSLNAPQEGAGLGLSISRSLAEAMGGSLTVESAVGRGSTFTLGLRRSWTASGTTPSRAP